MYGAAAILLAMMALGCDSDDRDRVKEAGVVDAVPADAPMAADAPITGDVAPAKDVAVTGEQPVAGDTAGASDAGGDVSKPNVFIYAFSNKQLKVGTSDTVDVILSDPVKTKVYVEVVSNSDPQVVEVSYGSAKNTSIVIKFNVGQQKKSVKLKALKAGSAAITFKIHWTSQFSILPVMVVP